MPDKRCELIRNRAVRFVGCLLSSYMQLFDPPLSLPCQNASITNIPPTIFPSTKAPKRSVLVKV